MRPEAISAGALESEAMLPPTHLLPVAVDSLLPVPAAVAPLPHRWTDRSIPTASSVRVVDTSLVEAEAPVLVLAESYGFRLDEL